MSKSPLLIHCIYCGAAIPVTTILYADSDEEEKSARLAFELEHDRKCGPKSVGMIVEIAN